MAHTYDLTTDVGQVRLRIGDTVDLGEKESLTDAEVEHALELSDDIDVAAYVACRFLLAKLRVRVSQNVKGMSSNIRERVENTQKLLELLKEQVEHGEVDVYFEGISKADNDVHDADSDFTGAQFSLGQDDARGGQYGDEDDVD